jgi:NADH-quinone oxidoreductase subunit A
MRLTPNNPDTAKLSMYECDFEPYEDARNIFDVRFYLVAIFFLIFDLEIVFFFMVGFYYSFKFKWVLVNDRFCI